MEKKLSPIQIVSREMGEHSSMTDVEIEDALKDVLDHLQFRARTAIEVDPSSNDSTSFARQYQAVGETVLFLGTQLIALEDITVDDSDRIKN